MFNQRAFSKAVAHFIGDKPYRRVAAEVGVHHVTLWRISKGKAPSKEVLAKLCHAMQVPVDTFFGRD